MQAEPEAEISWILFEIALHSSFDHAQMELALRI
jgi:hypothetical protein